MLQQKKTLVFRFNHEVPLNLPLAVRSSGTYTLLSEYPPEPSFQKWFCEIFWSVKGCGEFDLDGTKVQVKENELFYYLPGETHTIRAISSAWTYHWLSLDHQLGPQWLEAFGFTKRPFSTSEHPGDLFKKLQSSLRQGTSQGERKASHLAHAILLAASEKIYTRSESRHSLSEECKKKMDERFSNPDLNVNKLADELKVHRATLFRSFLSTYGITPSHYLQSRRLHRAMELLKKGGLKLSEISLKVGIEDSNYLSRLIRRSTGTSPRNFQSKITHPIKNK